MVDYLQDIDGAGELKCREFKELARDLDCPVIVISTVSEKADRRVNGMPQLNDVNEFELMKGHFDKLLLVSRDPKLSLSDSKKIARIDVYSDEIASPQKVNLVWDGSYCGYSESL